MGQYGNSVYLPGERTKTHFFYKFTQTAQMKLQPKRIPFNVKSPNSRTRTENYQYIASEMCHIRCIRFIVGSWQNLFRVMNNKTRVTVTGC